MWRLRAAVGAAPPGDRPDVLIVADPVLFARDGLLAASEAAAAAARLPAWADREGRWTSIYVQPIVAIHNAHYTSSRPEPGSDFADGALRRTPRPRGAGADADHRTGARRAARPAR